MYTYIKTTKKTLISQYYILYLLALRNLTILIERHVCIITIILFCIYLSTMKLNVFSFINLLFLEGQIHTTPAFLQTQPHQVSIRRGFKESNKYCVDVHVCKPILEYGDVIIVITISYSPACIFLFFKENCHFSEI